MNCVQRWYASAIVTSAFVVMTGTVAAAQVAGEVRGRVTDSETARPIANARVELSGRTESVRSGADGSYVVRGVEPASYVITVRSLGYASTTKEVAVSNGRVTQLDVVLIARVAFLSDVQVRAARDTTAPNTTVIDRATIEQTGRRDLGELIQTTPGVVVTQAGGPGQPSHVSIRGSSSNQVLVLVDGVPLNSAISGSADLSRVALETVEKVTVRTGAQSARYGPRAMAGVIEIETRKSAREISALVKSGAFGEYNGSLTLGRSLPTSRGSFGVSLATDYRTVDGDFSYTLPALRGGGRASRINSDATSKQLLTGISFDGGAASVALRGAWQDTDRGLAGTIIQPSISGRQGHTRTSGGASAQGIAKHVAWTLATDVTHERGTFIDLSPPFGQAFSDTISATGTTTSGSASFSGNALSVSTGGELRTLDISSTMLAVGAPHWQQLLGAWANAQYSRNLSASVRVDADVSGRVDRNSLSSDVVVSPRGSLRVARGALATSFSIGSGYAPPTLSDQFFNEGVQVRANPNLGPERTRRDMEARLSIRETSISLVTIAGEGAVYRSNIDGMILWFPDFRFIWSPSNFDVKRSGWELSGKVGVPAAKVDIQGTFNRNDVTYTGNVLSGQVAYRPRNSANVNVGYSPKTIRIDFATRYVGTRRTVAGSRLNSLDPYWMHNVRVSGSKALHGWNLSPAFSVENVFNRAAAMLVDYPFPPRTWTVSLRVRRSTLPSL